MIRIIPEVNENNLVIGCVFADEQTTEYLEGKTLVEIENTNDLFIESHIPKYKIEDGAMVLRPSEDFEKEAQIEKALHELEQTDATISRISEDIYDVLSDAQKGSLTTETKNKITNKKEKRAAYLALKG